MSDPILNLSVSELCDQAQVSTSGYYAWKGRKIVSCDDDFEDEIIHLIFEMKKRKAGAKTIKMILGRDFGIVMNLKKIRRIKKKLGLETIIRRRNKYSNLIKGKYHKSVNNYLKQNFEVKNQDQVYSTDITYLYYGSGLTAYMSAVKDLKTKEIVHYSLSRSLTLDIVLDGLDELFIKIPLKVRRKLMVHSDQGCHYTSNNYRKLLKDHKIKQSMSRKGNCLDNAPIESFFGHMKDELDLKNCKRYEDLVLIINEYVNYYNRERPQWGLKGRTPAECRRLN